jgi:hypothetical protein
MFGPVKTLIYGAALWLMLAFFVWFSFRHVLLLPVLHMSKFVLMHWNPAFFLGSDLIQTQDYVGSLPHWEISWNINLPVDTSLMSAAELEQFNAAIAAGQKPISALGINPMIYGYSFPLFAGLAMATPNSLPHRFLQIFLSWLVLWPVQSFGVIFDTLKTIGVTQGELGLKVMADMGLNLTGVSLAYQFGYLILPAIVPVMLWASMNQKFVKSLVQHGRDPYAED